MSELKKYLEKCKMVDCQDVIVTLGKTEYNNAVMYKNPNINNSTMIYIIADKLPRKDSNKVVWADCNNYIHIAAYMTNDIKPEFEHCHPFGKNFILGIVDKENNEWLLKGNRGGDRKVILASITIK